MVLFHHFNFRFFYAYRPGDESDSRKSQLGNLQTINPIITNISCECKVYNLLKTDVKNKTITNKHIGSATAEDDACLSYLC